MLNKVILHGRLTADPEIRSTQNGTAVARFTVAVDRSFTNKETGEREADFINCQAWKNSAEFVGKYFKKGSLIIVDGNLRNNNYTDQNGVKHYAMVVVADSVSFGGSKSDNGGQQAQQYNTPPQQNYQQYQQNTAQGFVQQAQTSNIPAQQANIGDLSGYEEIISDGQVPF
jgi:single-strand DNA-binding protein